MNLSLFKLKSKFLLIASTLLAIIILLDNCNPAPKKNSDQVKYPEGQALLKSKCVSCHHPTAAVDNRLAPPMYAVKMKYLKVYKEESQFIEAMQAFLSNPKEAKVLMKGAVKKFGLMPALNYPEKEIEAIAKYIYHNEMVKPDWFDEHYKQKREKKRKQHSNEKVVQDEESKALSKGKAIALKTKSALGKNLMQAINERGAEGAVEFCNIKALPITDSLAALQNAKIKRVSDQNRNPINKANQEELAYIQASKKALSSGNSIKPIVKKVNGKWIGYYPILTNAMCLQCHGQENHQIAANTLAKIKENYPQDKATGYGENELRGIWVVEF